MNPGTLLIRADANVAIGTGHIMRCLALAQGWREAGGEAMFAIAEAPHALRRRLTEQAFRIVEVAGSSGSVEDLQSTRTLVTAESPSWVVLDGYKFKGDYQAQLRQLCHVLVVDDTGQQQPYAADIIVNQNAHASETFYLASSRETCLLLGPRYAMLRDEFSAYRDWKREISPLGRRILVTMGGSDPRNYTSKVLQELMAGPDTLLECRVIVGGSAQNQEQVEAIAREHTGRIEVLRDARNMPEVMAWADLAFSAAGSTCWEMCLLGLPAMLFVAAENQSAIAAELEKTGAAVNVGRSEQINWARVVERALGLLNNPDARTAMSRAGQILVDGRGRERVLDAMRTGVTACA